MEISGVLLLCMIFNTFECAEFWHTDPNTPKYLQSNKYKETKIHKKMYKKMHSKKYTKWQDYRF